MAESLSIVLVAFFIPVLAEQYQPKASSFSKTAPRVPRTAHTLGLSGTTQHPAQKRGARSNHNHPADLIDVPVHPFTHSLTHSFFLFLFLQIDYALSGSGGALGYDQIQLLDASNPPTAGLDASASAWEMTTQTLLNDWNEELPPQFRQGL